MPRLHWLLFLVLLAGAIASAQAPSVTNVTMMQSPTPTSTQVDIYYDLIAPNGPCDISLWLSKDGGADGFIFPITSITGDIANMSTGAGYHIVWDIRADYPEEYLADARIRVVAQDETPEPEEITLILPGDVPLELVRIPAGTFMMGRYPGEQDSYDSEDPQHEVTLQNDFYIGKYEVTQAQWIAVMGSWPGTEPSIDYGLGNNYPAYYISWDDAQNFITALNVHIANSGQGPAMVRLPSEVEWEYACRAGTTTRYYFGDSLGCAANCSNCAVGTLPGNRTDYMWYCGNNNIAPDSHGSKPVGAKMSNAFGLYDMSGNVYEWCEDDYHSSYNGAPFDASAWVDSPRASDRVFRGGNWESYARYCRSAFRYIFMPDSRDYGIGFRLACSVAAPDVTSFTINNGDISTDNPEVMLNYSTTNSPTEYMASEYEDFNDATWQPYSTAPTFTLSGSAITRTIYFKTRNAIGESPVVSDTIYLQPQMVSVEAGTFEMGRPYAWDPAWGSERTNELPVHEVALDAYEIGKYEVTNQQYCDVLNWALAQGYLEDSEGGAYMGGLVYAYGKPIADIEGSHNESQISYTEGIFIARNRTGYNSEIFSMADHPVVRVSWYGSVAFCNWLSEMIGMIACYDVSSPDWPLVVAPPKVGGYRLPTEAEWERAGAWDSTKHWLYGMTSDIIDFTSANFKHAGIFANPIGLTTLPYTSPRGWYDEVNPAQMINPDILTVNAVSPIGAYDMSGNVFEWCHDWYQADFYSVSPTVNPLGPETGTYRILRGGAWDGFDANPWRSSCRGYWTPEVRAFMYGFRLAQTPIVPPEMLDVEAGTFEMGRRDDGDDGTYGTADELPRHDVTLNRYQIGKYEVTNQQYCNVLNWANNQGHLYSDAAGTPWTGAGDIYAGGVGACYPIVMITEVTCNIEYTGTIFVPKTRTGLPGATVYSMASHPMVRVTWYGSVAYCNWLSEIEGLEPCYDKETENWPLVIAPPNPGGYRLPTEAEWERAAAWDGSKHWIYGFTSDVLVVPEQTNCLYYDGSSYIDVNPLGLFDTPYTSPVGWFDGVNISPNGDIITADSPSPVGAYDMSGNVWEFCHDWYLETYYTEDSLTNPVGPMSGSHRVTRGGRWGNYSYYCRTAERAGPFNNISHPGIGFRLARTPFDLPEMITVPAGTFEMGRPYAWDSSWGEERTEELPAHEVTLDAYEIGKYPITNQEFADVLNWALTQGYLTDEFGAPYSGGLIYAYGEAIADTVSNYPASAQVIYENGVFTVRTRVGYGGQMFSMSNHPMVRVSWYGAAVYCNWLSEMSGFQPCYDTSTWERYEPIRNGYRLPTEAEWERAAAWDGSKHWRYAISHDNIDISRANYESTNPLGLLTIPYTSPVGWYNGLNPVHLSTPGLLTVNSPSPVGAYDMSGNVWEWCHDWWHRTYTTSSVSNPSGPEPSSHRLLRGGSWYYFVDYCRTSDRGWPREPEIRVNSHGFRVVRTP